MPRCNYVTKDDRTSVSLTAKGRVCPAPVHLVL